MARETGDWKEQLQNLRDQIIQNEQAIAEQQGRESKNRIKRNLCRSFIGLGRVVINTETAKIDHEATLEAIDLSGRKTDIEDLIESSINRGELVVYEYEPYSLLAMIQQPFWDEEVKHFRNVRAYDSGAVLTMNQIKSIINDRYPWMESEEYQRLLDVQLENAKEKLVLDGGYYIGDEQGYAFSKNNMAQLSPLDNGLINPFLRNPFTGSLDYE